MKLYYDYSFSIRCAKMIFFISFLLLILSNFTLHAMQNQAISIEEIEKDKSLLKEIAKTIIERKTEQQRLKEKMCKHDQIMTDVWKSGKKWGELGLEKQKELTKHIPKSHVQSILKRDRHALMSNDVLNDPYKFAKIIIENGDPSLVVIGEKKDQYGIMVTYNTNEVIGFTYTKEENGKIKENKDTKIYISFNITDIVDELKNTKLWNKEKSGAVTTMCVHEDKQEKN